MHKFERRFKCDGTKFNEFELGFWTTSCRLKYDHRYQDKDLERIWIGDSNLQLIFIKFGVRYLRLKYHGSVLDPFSTLHGVWLIPNPINWQIVYRPPWKLSTSHLENCLSATWQIVYKPPGKLSTSHLANCLPATWQIVYKPPGKLSISHLANYLPATWQTIYQPPGKLSTSHLANYLPAIWKIVCRPPGKL